MGPNVKKLIITKMARDMVPDGGGLADGINALQDTTTYARTATKWVHCVIQEVKDARNNPYGDDDEAIAAEILRLVEVTKGGPGDSAIRQ